MELGDKHLKVQLASIGFTQASGLEMGVNAMSMFAGTTSAGLEEGRVLQLLNMVTAEELIDNDEYEGPFPSLTFHLPSLCPLLLRPFSLPKLSADLNPRNPRRHCRRMRKIRPSHRDQDSPSQRWIPPINRCGQNFRQVR